MRGTSIRLFRDDLVRAAALAAALLASGCVSLEETALAPGSVRPGQRTVVCVFAAPGPIMNESNSSLDNAAKIVPGLGFIIKATQNKLDLEASRDLQQYLPAWKPAAEFYPALSSALSGVGFAGVFSSAAEAGLDEKALDALNAASDVNDWQIRYYSRNADDLPARDFSKVPGLGGALVLQVDLAPMATSDGSTYWTPGLGAVVRLVRADDNRRLWRHEAMVEDKPALKETSEFKKNPSLLLASWRALMPELARSLAAALRKAQSGELPR